LGVALTKVFKPIFYLFIACGLLGVVYTLANRPSSNSKAVNAEPICDDYKVGSTFDEKIENDKLKNYMFAQIPENRARKLTSLPPIVDGAQAIYLLDVNASAVCRLQIKDKVIVGR
jgi:hypothetical protein